MTHLSLSFSGELHHTQLINFTIDKNEIMSHLPKGIKPFLYDDRALFSIVNVNLKHMRLEGMPKATAFNYKHVALRLVIEHPQNRTENGIYFYQSFTDKALLGIAGNLVTNYNFCSAHFSETLNLFELKKDDYYIAYAFDDKLPKLINPSLKPIIQSLDSAFHKSHDLLYKTVVQRERWPLRAVDCYHFETNFFKTAKFVGAFIVPEVIHYNWQSPQLVA